MAAAPETSGVEKLVNEDGTGAIQATAAAANSVLITGAGSIPALSQTLPATVQGNITATGALTTGSIASGFGTIATGNNITTSATVQGGSVTATGVLSGNSLSINAGAFAVKNGGGIDRGRRGPGIHRESGA